MVNLLSRIAVEEDRRLDVKGSFSFWIHIVGRLKIAEGAEISGVIPGVRTGCGQDTGLAVPVIVN